MAVSKQSVQRELQMLTGKVNKDSSYLYYLLLKDGSYFEEIKPAPQPIQAECTVNSFEDWFNEL